ncbi:rod shape-determining protein MreC [Verrucomicrobiota bacterium]
MQEQTVEGRKYFFRVALLLALVAVLNLPVPASMRVKAAARESVAPYQNTMFLLLLRAWEMVGLMVDMSMAVDERRELLAENAELRLEIRRMRRLEVENRELREQAGLEAHRARGLVLCEVVSRGDLSGWWQTVQLGKGEGDGIRPSQTVVTVDGLVGRIASVSKNTAEVLLITDPNCRVSCKLTETGAFGILKGAGVTAGAKKELDMLYAAEPCAMDYIPREAGAPKRTAVVTSGLGGAYPEGLLVGYVVDSALVDSKLYWRARVAPAARLGRLRYVFVMVDEKEGPDR